MALVPALLGIDVTTALKVLAEVGADFSKFKDAKHFASWLGLCPGTKISGDKIISAATTKNTNRAAQALKQAAVNLRASANRHWGLTTEGFADVWTRERPLPPAPIS